jgi:hypothetical protein
MSLITEMKTICEELTAAGWDKYLKSVAGLNIDQPDEESLLAELSRPLSIQRSAPGFSDFAAEGVRAIEPGKPALSLLFHALAYPGLGDGYVDAMPFKDQLEITENFIYGVKPRSMAELRLLAGGTPLALVVFAAEYRPASQTVHQKHADMCYSRTGVARLGTERANYVASARGFSSFGQSAKQICAVPCRYSAYIAAQMNGDASNFGPMRFRGPGTVATTGAPVKSDAERLFWVPIHKVFNGDECIRDLDEKLELIFTTDHRNEKLRRFHLYLKDQGIGTGFDEPTLSRFPFVISERRLAEIKPSAMGSSLWVMPIAQPLVQEARFEEDGKRIGFRVPPAGTASYGSYKVPPRGAGGRPAPELVYVRKAIDDNGCLVNLNAQRNMLEILYHGGFVAQHYVDYSGDGWVRADCEQLALSVPQSLPAYSVLSPPDFYPRVKQQDVLDWWRQSTPPAIRQHLFLDDTLPIPPEPLSDCRITANITFRQKIAPGKTQPIFNGNDDSYPAIVSGLGAGSGALTKVTVFDDQRVSPLPDGASGLFAPGWDISRGQSDDENTGQSVLHLAGYGGSSPFLEDIRICAAQSAFWPAVAPDTARLYEPGTYPSVTPLPQSFLGWDGLQPPVVSGDKVVFEGIAYSDYIEQALDGKGFKFGDIGKVDARHYETWTLLMARVYQTMGLVTSLDKAKWALVYFERSQTDFPEELSEAEAATKRKLRNPYRFFLVRTSGKRRLREDPAKVEVSFDRRFVAHAAPSCVLYNDSFSPGWLAREF